MKVLYYDCFSGISGDMNLGAMIDIGVDKDYLIKELSKLCINEYEIVVSKASRRGISGTKVDVILKEDPEEKACHRNLKDIVNIINSSFLDEKVKRLSLEIFTKIALAEAKVHNVSINEIHFHEVGAVDSIVDIVGAAICLNFLKADKVMSSRVEVGSGFVKCAHGILPVPAPATAEILKDIPIKSENVPFEATTPTGAAILACAVNEFTENKRFRIKAVGFGIGQKDEGEVPNALRLFLGETEEEDFLSKGRYFHDYLKEEASIIECNIDDMNPEIYDFVMDKLFKQGVMDAYMTPIIMKKGRPSVKFSVLCGTDKEETVEKLLLSETTTLGVRKYRVDKVMLPRKNIKVSTVFGDIDTKVSYIDGENVKVKPEYEECKKIAEQHMIPIRNVYEEVLQKITKNKEIS